MPRKPIPPNRTLYYVPRRIAHHAQHGGYDAVYRWMDMQQAYSKKAAWMALHLPECVKWRLRRMRPQPVGNDCLVAEIAAIPTIARKEAKLCHFIYGEDTYFFATFFRNANCKVIASYHYPPDLLIERVSPGAVCSLDAVVVVGSNQVSYFSRYLPNNKIHVVPHHIDVTYFSPAENSKAESLENRIIFAGSMMRDFETLLGVAAKLKEAGSDYVIHAVTSKNNQEKLRAAPNIVCHSDIGDEELKELYRTSRFGVMPLLDCTANNSVLEMMAVGLPVVCTDIGGIRDYLTSDGAEFAAKGDVDDFAEKVLMLSSDPERCRMLGAHNRQRAIECFSFEAVAAKLKTVYEQVLDEPPHHAFRHLTEA